MKNDVNKVNAAFCGMRFQQYRTSLTMFYWKSPFEICDGPVDCFFFYSAQTRDDGSAATTALRQTDRRSDVRVGRDLASGGARSSGPNSEQDVRKMVLGSFLGDYHSAGPAGGLAGNALRAAGVTEDLSLGRKRAALTARTTYLW